MLFLKQKSDIETIKYYDQLTNDCCSQAVGRGIADRQQTATYRGKEINGFNSFIPWLYGMYHQKIVGRPSNGGCSVSGMMNLINRFGMLPDDIDGLPSYKDAIKSWSENKTIGNEAFEKQ